MKTSDILNLDCRNPENIMKINKFLYKVGSVKKICSEEDLKNKPRIPLVTLERVYFDVCAEHGYDQQGIKQYYQDGVFEYHIASVIKRRDGVNIWVGNVYGLNMWELFAKMIIKICADIIKERKEKEKEEK